MIATILIANRGEIACRIIRTCRRLGIRSVAVFSEADAQSLHAQMADEAIYIGPSPALDSYLDLNSIITAAHRTGADSVHPGYGFLAENPDFARACEDADLTFIGPSVEALSVMGDKRAAKELMIKAGIPVIPGYHGDDTSNEIMQQEADRLGYPLMVKAIAGGGGRGMRVVGEPSRLPEALAAARSEARQAFGDDSLLLEVPLSRPRHIEIQVFADRHDNVVNLGERECSVQRRYQKVIEESPSPAITAELRKRLCQTAVAATHAISYTNAGTVEFLVDENGAFYFLEMNTRLQVEHPVTEMRAGLDLVEWQIRIADGEPLPLSQDEIELSGHAIEARIYAEDPAKDFQPTAGRILHWEPSDATGIRVDSGIQTDAEVSAFYDPLLAKIIAHGTDRNATMRRLIRALEDTALLGLINNLDFLKDILRHPGFETGRLHTRFLEEHFQEWRPASADDTAALITATLAQLATVTPAGEKYIWGNDPNRPHRSTFQVGGDEELIEVEMRSVQGAESSYLFTVSGEELSVVVDRQRTPNWVLTVNGHRQRATAVATGNRWWVKTRTGTVTLRAVSPLTAPQPSIGAAGSLRAPMPGSILAVLIEVGETVRKGQPLMKLEAMKMEHTIRAAADGVVETICFSPGDTVEADAQLLRLVPIEK